MHDITIDLLADHAELIASVGTIRWREWGRPPEPTELTWWLDTTRQEVGREGLPITWVAVDADGEAVGAVGLLEYDLDERRDRTPWLVGMIVSPEWRGRGIGKALVRSLESWARSRAYRRVWVATGDHAVRFYEKCGWKIAEAVPLASGETAIVLSQAL